MDVEDDDLSALRLAALASLSSKAKVATKKSDEEEDDLEALRLEALMTRRQNQKIQVISQHPAYHQIPRAMPAVSRQATNLISLTPDPQTCKSNAGPQSLKPADVTMHSPQCSVSQASSENKVLDKFSRFNSDTSSDEEEENNDKKKNANSEREDSDIESVASERSFSSVSNVAEVEDNLSENGGSGGEAEDGSPDEDQTQKEPDVVDNEAEDANSGSDDNISIIDNEDEDILAAIEDYLEDRPVKGKPGKTAEDMSTRHKKINETKPVSGEGKKTKPLKSRKKSSLKASSNVGKKMVEKRKSKGILGKIAPSTGVPHPVDDTKSDIGGKSQRNTKKVDSAKQRKLQKTEQPQTRRGEKQERGDMSGGNLTGHLKGEQTHTIPVVMRKIPSPPRQRRDSDLDSVGTSDLSFLGSGSEDDVETKPTSKVKTRPASAAGGCEDTSRLRENNAKQKQWRKTTQRRNETTRQDVSRGAKETREARPHEGPGSDLRKKLESKGLQKKTNTNNKPRTDNSLHKTDKTGRPSGKNNTSKSLHQEPIKRLSPVVKSGVINLKKKSTRCSVPAKSNTNSREASPHVSLPDINEARRIIITRVNPSVAARVAVKVDAKANSKEKFRPESEKNLKQNKNTVEQSTASYKIDGRSNTEEKPMRNRKRSVLPPNTPAEEKKQKLDKIRSNKMSAQSPSPKSEEITTKEGGSSGSSNQGDAVDEEEVFTVDDSALPLYDDVLGNFGSSAEEGEYFDDITKNRKRLQSSSKKKKKSERTREKLSSRKRVPDSRRIVPKSSPERMSDSDGSRPDLKKVPKKPRKKSVHQRLGLPLADSEGRMYAPDRFASRTMMQRSGSRDGSSRASSIRMEESDGGQEYDFEGEANFASIESHRSSQRAGSRTSKPRSKVEISSKVTFKSGLSGSNDENQNLSDESDKNVEKASGKQKRKILVGRRKEGKELSCTDKSERRKKINKKAKMDVKDRLGKVVLSSVLKQPPVEPESRHESGRSDKRQRKDGRRLHVSNSSSKGGNNDDELEARIRRINEQNGHILRRQKEIELEKEKFGF